MLFKGCFIFCLGLLFSSEAAKAQMAINFSPIAYSTSGVTATGGSPFTFFEKTKCLVMGNGMTVLTVVFNNKGEFAKSCSENIPRTSLNTTMYSLRVFPNPTNGPATVQCEGSFDINAIGHLKMIGLDGKLVMAQTVVMKELQAGIIIQTGLFSSGTYLISVDYMNQHFSSKLLKF